jgi:hypothetical protein
MRKYSNIITTSQELGNFFTLFYRSKTELLKNIAINSGLAQSSVKRGTNNEAVNMELSEEPFHPNEIFQKESPF